jgi:hypothetical protein
MAHRFRLVFQKVSTQSQLIFPSRLAGTVVPLPGLIDYNDWQNANDVRPDNQDRISPKSHFSFARRLIWTVAFEIGLVIVLSLCW